MTGLGAWGRQPKRYGSGTRLSGWDHSFRLTSAIAIRFLRVRTQRREESLGHTLEFELPRHEYGASGGLVK
jgi:hypothetical protein